ncbi:MAG: tetratricopeptide repeat protein [Desulfarculus sp.]|nr:tetratricopeptide repeat protein [Desulfarculus sp.]
MRASLEQLSPEASQPVVFSLESPPLRLELPAGSRLEPGGAEQPGLLFRATLPWPGHLLVVEANPRSPSQPPLEPAWTQAEQERLAMALPRASGWQSQTLMLAGRTAHELTWSTPEQQCRRIYLPAQGWLYQVTLAHPVQAAGLDLASMVESWGLAPAPSQDAPAQSPVAQPPAPAPAAGPLSPRQALCSLDPPTLARATQEAERRAEQDPRDALAAARMVEAKAWRSLALAIQGQPAPSADWARLRAKAVAVYRRHPGAAATRRALGMAMILEERPAKARQYLEAAAQAEPSDGVNLVALALVPGQETATRADLGRRAVKASPELPAAHLVLAWALEDQGQAAQAAAPYQAALALQPGNLPALIGLARLEMDAPATRQAAGARLARVLEIMPDHQAARFNLALVRLAQDRPQEAQRLTQEVLAKEPQDAAAHNLRGLALLAQKQYAQAGQAFEAASQADPRHAQALYNLGGVCAGQLQNNACAGQAFRRFLELEPQGPRADKARAWLGRHGQ